MTKGLVRQESWINELLRINSYIGRTYELEFVYSPLYAMPCQKNSEGGELCQRR